ncbi:hypothetical protein HMPREF1051_2431 [Neisseria sicca VK64]|uniref:Uncharacterized protein n=1 Tax=Neisseria sicca VK64 TaxID=1095748 RepID=I2NH88_NEISI|nr:hypothetical protein HMPREF1051_2431 [Neisseria sicca VK64]
MSEQRSSEKFQTTFLLMFGAVDTDYSHQHFYNLLFHILDMRAEDWDKQMYSITKSAIIRPRHVLRNSVP